jgi:hypothetical protein
VTIEIHRPELEALIPRRMKSGGFQNVEDVLMQVLKTSSTVAEHEEKSRGRRTGADLVAALQASPYRELDIEPQRLQLSMHLSDVTF